MRLLRCLFHVVWCLCSQDLFSQSGARGRLLDKISGHQLKLLDAQSELDAVRFGLHEVDRKRLAAHTRGCLLARMAGARWFAALMCGIAHEAQPSDVAMAMAWECRLTCCDGCRTLLTSTIGKPAWPMQWRGCVLCAVRCAVYVPCWALQRTCVSCN